MIEQRRVTANGSRSQMVAKQTFEVPQNSEMGFKPSRRAVQELLYYLIQAGYTDEGRVALDAMRFPNGSLGKLVKASFEEDE